jgi:hypothetical protein
MRTPAAPAGTKTAANRGHVANAIAQRNLKSDSPRKEVRFFSS